MGGYIAQYSSWRWTLWVTVVMAGVLAPAVFWMPETHSPTILKRKVRLLKRKTGNPNLYPEGEKVIDRAFVMKALALPIKLLFTELVIFLVAVYIAVVTAILYVSALTRRESRYQLANIILLDTSILAYEPFTTPQSLLLPRLETYRINTPTRHTHGSSDEPTFSPKVTHLLPLSAWQSAVSSPLPPQNL